MEVDAPETIVSTGGRYALEDNAETPDTQEVIYHYAKGDKGFDLVWSHTDAGSQGFGGNGPGIIFHGTEATLVSGYSSHQILPEKGRKIELPPVSLPRSVGHHREWIDAIKTRDAVLVPLRVRASPLHRRAPGEHRPLDRRDGCAGTPRRSEITNHKEANRHLTREEYRSPWTIPEV